MLHTIQTFYITVVINIISFSLRQYGFLAFLTLVLTSPEHRVTARQVKKKSRFLWTTMLSYLALDKTFKCLNNNWLLGALDLHSMLLEPLDKSRYLNPQTRQQTSGDSRDRFYNIYPRKTILLHHYVRTKTWLARLSF